MIPLKGVKAVEFSELKPGELFVRRDGGDPKLCVCVKDDKGAAAAVVFSDTKSPTLTSCAPDDRSVFLGQRAAFRVENLLRNLKFTETVPENPLTIQKEIGVVVEDARGGAQRSHVVMFADGNVIPLSTPGQWFVTKWELGFVDDTGKFQSLHQQL